MDIEIILNKVEKKIERLCEQQEGDKWWVYLDLRLQIVLPAVGDKEDIKDKINDLISIFTPETEIKVIDWDYDLEKVTK